jgi:hypothetical protein
MWGNVVVNSKDSTATVSNCVLLALFTPINPKKVGECLPAIDSKALPSSSLRINPPGKSKTKNPPNTFSEAFVICQKYRDVSASEHQNAALFNATATPGVLLMLRLRIVMDASAPESGSDSTVLVGGLRFRLGASRKEIHYAR